MKIRQETETNVAGVYLEIKINKNKIMCGVNKDIVAFIKIG